MSKTKKIKALYTLFKLANKAKDIGDYKLGNLTFGLAISTLDKEMELIYENADNPLSAYFDIVTIVLNGRSLCIPVPLLNKDTLAECLKKGKVIDRLEHNRQYRQFEDINEWRKAYRILETRFFKILKTFFNLNNVESALCAVDLSERQKEFEKWAFEALIEA